jgi:hypothetical protein
LPSSDLVQDAIHLGHGRCPHAERVACMMASIRIPSFAS